MSATGRPGSTRTACDFYGTPSWVVERFLEAKSELFAHKRWLEPCSGDGAIIRAVNAYTARFAGIGMRRPHWTALDIRPECEAPLRGCADDVVTGIDVAQSGVDLVGCDVILTNPPFELARPILENCLGKADVVAFLLRLNFLASEDRADLFRTWCPDIYVLPNRPCFKRVAKRDARTGKWRVTSSDSCEYGWFVWGREPCGHGIVQVLAATPEDVRAAAREAAPIEDENGNAGDPREREP